MRMTVDVIAEGESEMNETSGRREPGESGEDGGDAGHECGQIIAYDYTLKLADGQEKTFRLRLDRTTLGLVPVDDTRPPKWAELSCQKCPNCPLLEAEHAYCPIATNLPELMEFTWSLASFEDVTVTIETEERRYARHTTVQAAISSLLGIYMVTSGCPVMDKLRPMVRFHLPFATSEETTYRAVTMYLMAQYLRLKRGKSPDWELRDLRHIYSEVQTVNASFVRRLHETEIGDANTNALVRLDAFAGILLLSMDMDRLENIESLFASSGLT